MTGHRTRIATQNTKATLSDRIAAACLDLALAQDLDVWAGQEWGPNRNDVLADAGDVHVWGRRKDRRDRYDRATPGGILFVRHADGGEPMGFSDRYRIDNVERVILAEGRAVRPQPGTRRVEDDNDATLVTTTDLVDGAVRRFLNGHLPAHVQRGAENRYRYPSDPRAHLHQEARDAAAAIGADYVTLDTNWHDLRLPGYTSCWDGRKAVGTLGNRAIDTVYARHHDRATRVRVLGTPAREHKLVVVDWPA